MPVQPDRAEPVIAESGDSAEDTVGAQLHRHAGAKDTHRRAHTYRNTHTHICTAMESRRSNLVSVSIRGLCVCITQLVMKVCQSKKGMVF